MVNRLIALLLFIVASASCGFSQVCKISGANDSVEVFGYTLKDNNTVEVTVSNDSESNNANVTVSVEVAYRNGSYFQRQTFQGKGLAKANSSTTITVGISPNWSNNPGYKIDSVKVTGITGSKCM